MVVVVVIVVVVDTSHINSHNQVPIIEGHARSTPPKKMKNTTIEMPDFAVIRLFLQVVCAV